MIRKLHRISRRPFIHPPNHWRRVERHFHAIGLSGAVACRRKFLRQFPGGFRDETYLDWERDYKVETHQRWQAALGRDTFRELLREGGHAEAAARAVRVEQKSRHAMLFSFEKMARRDALRDPSAAEAFAHALSLSLDYHQTKRTGALSRTVDRGARAVDYLLRILVFNLGPTALELVFAAVVAQPVAALGNSHSG